MKFFGITLFEKKAVSGLPYQTPEELKLRMLRTTSTRRALFETPPEAQAEFGDFAPTMLKQEP
jgi:hypothetical protein